MKDKKIYIENLEKDLSVLHPNPRNLILLLQELVEDTYTILDVGCGMKTITRHLACKELVGVDIFVDYLTSKDICGDVREISEFIKPKSFDIVLCLDVIEHLEKAEGLKLIKDLENIAKLKVIFSTPLTWSKNNDAVENTRYWSFGNTYNYHKSTWDAEDFKQFGYLIESAYFFNQLFVAIKEI